ncbi:MAG TPA: hypothetical protein VK975_02915 [Acidimicrobiales bacterium]|nr:hypothetical protein [Acidimicrobiales bacterium]
MANGDDHTPPVQRSLTLIMTLTSPKAAAELRAALGHFQGVPPDANPVQVALDKIGTVHFGPLHLPRR